MSLLSDTLSRALTLINCKPGSYVEQCWLRLGKIDYLFLITHLKKFGRVVNWPLCAHTHTHTYYTGYLTKMVEG